MAEYNNPFVLTVKGTLEFLYLDVYVLLFHLGDSPRAMDITRGLAGNDSKGRSNSYG